MNFRGYEKYEFVVSQEISSKFDSFRRLFVILNDAKSSIFEGMSSYCPRKNVILYFRNKINWNVFHYVLASSHV
jgi:hypothetical protein